MPRPTTEQHRTAIKTAFKRLILDLGGYEAAVTCSRAAKTQLHRYGNVHDPECHAPADVIADLERIGGVPLVTQVLAGLAGYTLMPVSLAGEGNIAALLETLGADAGQTMADSLRAVGGGMAAPDMARVDADLAELIRVAMLAKGEIQRMLQPAAAGDGKGGDGTAADARRGAT